MSYDIKAEILRLKKEKNAVLLAHYYEEGEIQDLADHVGDSFHLAKMGQQSNSDVILLAGVVFMAESVKILNPSKKVLVPDLGAGCSLVDEAPYSDYLKWRFENPDGIAVTYINSSAEVKAISDVIVTSSNAKQIVSAIPQDRPVLFGPDKNLGKYLSKELNRPFILWPGSCQVHVLFSARRLFEMTNEHPDAVVIAHPECDPSVLQYADVIGSTSRLLEEVEKNPARKFIVATETGIFHQMKKKRPEAEILQAPTGDTSCACNDCPYMKLNTLEKIKRALETLSPEVVLSDELRLRAQVSLDRMMAITSGQSVQWPEKFVSP
ncbi:MAG: quinolinate synthase NadA [Pseudobdellovibrionaceae bacterium]